MSVVMVASDAVHVAMGSTCRHRAADTFDSCASAGILAAPLRASIANELMMPNVLATAVPDRTQTAVRGGNVRDTRGATRVSTTPSTSVKYSQKATTHR